MIGLIIFLVGISVVETIFTIRFCIQGSQRNQKKDNLKQIIEALNQKEQELQEKHKKIQVLDTTYENKTFQLFQEFEEKQKGLSQNYENKQNELNQELSIKQEEYNELDKSIKVKEEKYNNLKQNETKLTEHLQKLQEALAATQDQSSTAFENFVEVLERDMDLKEQEYEELVDRLHAAYDAQQTKLMVEIDEVQKELQKLKDSRTAAIEAQLREEQIKENSTFYTLTIDKTNEHDVKILLSIIPQLTNPRAVLMSIWSSYYSKPVNDLAARVLNGKVTMGIYKITNLQTGACYIGQAKDIKERWREHCKCGLGIDTPAGNKLYAAMVKYGLESFTFELLEECSAADLNNKEAYYIDQYSSYNFGYNSNTGVKNK